MLRRIVGAGGDARGAVFVEKLIALLPLLAVFFLGWELAELGAANLVVQRASAAAGRAAMVVLPDDPAFYADEPPDRYEGERRAEIELAAGMILSAIPQLNEDFEVDVSDPSAGFGQIDVTVRAPYRCGNVGLICGASDRLVLSSTTTHAYHGASYAYSSPSDGGESGAAAPAVGANVQALSAKAPPGKAGGPGNSAKEGCPQFKCDPDGSFARNPELLRQMRSAGNGTRLSAPSALQQRVRSERCQPGQNDGRNRAALAWECRDPQLGGKVVKSGVEDGVSRPGSGRREGRHAELDAFDKYAAELRKIPKQDRQRYDCRVTEIYTEREPCDDCKKALEGIFSVQGETGLSRVTYSFDFNVSSAVDPAVIQDMLKQIGACDQANQSSKNPSEREELEDELQRLQKKLRDKATADAKKQCTVVP